jgi:hypothetical protein
MNDRVKIVRGQWAGQEATFIERSTNHLRCSLRGAFISVHVLDVLDGESFQNSFVPMPEKVKAQIANSRFGK